MKLTKSQLKEIIREELKLTEAKWEVYDNYTGKTIKVVGNAGAATKLMNKLLDSGKVKEPAAKIVREGKLDEYVAGYSQIKWDNWLEALDEFKFATMRLGKYHSQKTGDKVDERIMMKNFKKYINPFYKLMQSWKRTKG
jgi:hypothetical protein